MAPEVGLDGTKRRAPIPIIQVAIIAFIPREQKAISANLNADLPRQKELCLALALALRVYSKLEPGRNVAELTQGRPIFQDQRGHAPFILNTCAVGEISLET